MISPLTLSDIANATGAQWAGTEAKVSAVSTDSRSIGPGSVFVALRGERFDGHAFLSDAANAGAAAAIVEETSAADVTQLVVDNTLKAYGQIAALNRDRFKACGGKVIALTGSSGKTSCKEMLAAILKQQFSVLATRGNLNNEIGVPKTLLEIDASHNLAVVEMGAAKRGDIGYLCDFAKPDIALITNAGPAHLEGFGSVQTVAETKGEIYRSLGKDATAVINADDHYAALWRDYAAAAQVVNVSLGDPEADVYAKDLQLSDKGTQFTLVIDQVSTRVRLPVLGQAMVRNALLAAAAARAAGASVDAIQQGLAALKPVAGRVFPMSQSWGTLIDDSYNANPASVKAAIDVLAEFSGRRLLVLGAMAELGPDSAALHREVGEYARSKGLDCLLVCGEVALPASEGAGEIGEYFSTKETLQKALLEKITAGDTVLVKGSRSAGMDSVVKAVANAQVTGGNLPC